jgi:hypothetical protein
MKKLLLATVLWFAAIVALAASPASAEMRPYYHSGHWTNYAGVGDKNAPLCSMMSTTQSWGEFRIGGIKYDSGLYVQLSTQRWRIRKGVNVAIQIGFDNNPWIGDARAVGDGQTIFINIAPDHVDGFLREVGEADTMWFRFAGNDEWNWSFNMTGSRNATNALRECMARISAPPAAPTYVQPAPAPAPGAPAPGAPAEPSVATLPTSTQSSVPILVGNDGRVVMVDVLMGGQPIRMLLDTGAEVCSVTEVVANRLVADGQGSWDTDFVTVLADGSRRTTRAVIIREMRIGSHIVRNIKAGVTSSNEMLLSFPVLNSIAPFTIDTRARELIFHHKSAS